jgi:hypothetical protein
VPPGYPLNDVAASKEEKWLEQRIEDDAFLEGPEFEPHAKLEMIKAWGRVQPSQTVRNIPNPRKSEF